MYQPYHKLRVRFAEMELRQGDVAQAAGMAKSTMTARMKVTRSPAWPLS